MNLASTLIICATFTCGLVAAQSPNLAEGKSKTLKKTVPPDVSAILESGKVIPNAPVGENGLDTAIAADGSIESPSNPTLQFVTVAPEQKSEQLESALAQGVEPLQAGTIGLDPKKLTLHAPYPAKLLAAAPAGWRLAVEGNAPNQTRVVQFAPGVKVALVVKPHILIPDSNGTEIFTIPEPGFDSLLGDQQTTTVNAILTTSINQLDEDCVQLGNAIDNLQQLLIALPQLESPPASPATSGKKR
jgi:hypothetical protein